MSIESAQNCRLLVIDDNESIHMNFRKILADCSASTVSVESIAAELFGENVTENNFSSLTIDSACQGKLILKKPFDRTEMLLITTMLKTKWHLSNANSRTDVFINQALSV